MTVALFPTHASNSPSLPPPGTLLVLGGGMSGLTAAVEAAECGLHVHLADCAARPGGRAAALASYFPKRCPPSCGLELLLGRARRLPHLAMHFSVRLVDHALRDGRHTLLFRPDSPSAASVAARPGEMRLASDAVIVATGWRPYPLDKLARRGACHPLCLSNIQLEERLRPDAPGGGLLRPDTGRPPRRLAFVQCAGSRDVHALPYCSAVCCSATLKQCRLLLERYPALRIDVYFMDIRTPGRLFLLREQLAPFEAAGRLRFLPARPPRAVPREEGLCLPAENTYTGEHLAHIYDFIVWATGMQPSLAADTVAPACPLPLTFDDQGFVLDDPTRGIFAAGCARRPMNVSQSVRSGAAAVTRVLSFLRSRREVAHA